MASAGVLFKEGNSNNKESLKLIAGVKETFCLITDVDRRWISERRARKKQWEVPWFIGDELAVGMTQESGKIKGVKYENKHIL